MLGLKEFEVCHHSLGDLGPPAHFNSHPLLLLVFQSFSTHFHFVSLSFLLVFQLFLLVSCQFLTGFFSLPSHLYLFLLVSCYCNYKFILIIATVPFPIHKLVLSGLDFNFLFHLQNQIFSVQNDAIQVNNLFGNAFEISYAPLFSIVLFNSLLMPCFSRKTHLRCFVFQFQMSPSIA